MEETAEGGDCNGLRKGRPRRNRRILSSSTMFNGVISGIIPSSVMLNVQSPWSVTYPRRALSGATPC